MKNRIFLPLFALIILLSLSIFVYAAGSSTIPQPSSASAPVSKAEEKPKITVIEEEEIDCESISTRKLRIKCRLENRIEEDENIEYEKRIPEACRTLKNPNACIVLYKNVRQNKCYDLRGKDEDSCLKKTIFVKRARLTELPDEERVQKAREYLVLLLYELQERIENSEENGGIDSNNAATLIDSIVEIKQDILNEKSRSEILPKLNGLKFKLREFRSGEDSK